jgi:hypothetical protein
MSEPAGERHHNYDEQDESSEAPAHPGSTGVEASASEQDEENNQYQQQAHGDPSFLMLVLRLTAETHATNSADDSVQ